MEYIQNKIKEEYKEWKQGDLIFISSPTGSGKTTFCLDVLLKYAAQTNRRILYLVNRRILKEQLEIEISKCPQQLRWAIEIELYQTLENQTSMLRYDKYNNTYSAIGYYSLSYLEQYDYVICDECHYFLSDSNYNTNTGLSYRWIVENFDKRITIFLSATINNIKKYIEEDMVNKDYRQHSYYYSFKSFILGRFNIFNDSKIHEYSLKKDYGYININIIESRKHIADIVSNEGGKWVIFVDNIAYGKKLKKEIEAALSKDEKVLMIDSDYEKSEESKLEVLNISRSSIQSSKVLITTSVMDNGITLKDIELRKIIVLADTEEEFIQMLGRKREDGFKVDVYIYKYLKEHFQRRWNKASDMRNVADNYMKDIQIRVENELLKTWDWKRINECEYNLINQKHMEILKDVFEHKVSYDIAESIFNVYNGVLYLNKLSVAQIEYLNNYYLDMMKQFDEEDEYAFVRRQLSWLEYDEERIESIISSHKKDYTKDCMGKIMESFEQVINKPMKRGEVIDFKNNIREYLQKLLDEIDDSVEGKKTISDSLKKTSSSLSRNNLKFLRKNCGIPFELDIDGEFYTFKRTGELNDTSRNTEK